MPAVHASVPKLHLFSELFSEENQIVRERKRKFGKGGGNAYLLMNANVCKPDKYLENL